MIPYTARKPVQLFCVFIIIFCRSRPVQSTFSLTLLVSLVLDSLNKEMYKFNIFIMKQETLFFSPKKQGLFLCNSNPRLQIRGRQSSTLYVQFYVNIDTRQQADKYGQRSRRSWAYVTFCECFRPPLSPPAIRIFSFRGSFMRRKNIGIYNLACVKMKTSKLTSLCWKDFLEMLNCLFLLLVRRFLTVSTSSM